MITQPQPLATEKQKAYLNNLRRAIGVDRWNGHKRALGITTPGTESLTMKEAHRLITAINLALYGGYDDNSD